ncbi:uncharacterized protein Tco025E_03964 [Trypanosoma conorhini]|uniref:AAA+ ATPase domain-containing protein n=1 Tax=Trypanosoma conorhini TaxID=83891 RepID=A0A3R7NC59_9TRYP|nr:uncharacterized protein Tco025E_03964 [Trypanosoma conorhini]RNF19897.1 hypothetical protein Tco025E_03964 [Trypanosoma conorhini]
MSQWRCTVCVAWPAACVAAATLTPPSSLTRGRVRPWRACRQRPAGRRRGTGLQRLLLRIVALRLLPSTTDVIQLGWRATLHASGAAPGAPSSLRPTYSTRTHVVVRLASGRHLSAWAYGEVGLRLRVGAVLCALVYPTHTEDRSMALVIHSVAELTAAEEGAGALAWGSHSTQGESPAAGSSLPAQCSFGQLVEALAPEMAGQTMCKSLLLLVVVHTMYRAVRCRTRRPLHLLLLGASRSGKSALLRAFLRLLGPHATLVGAHVVHGQQRSVAMSQAITATYPHVRQQLLLGGAASTFDALVIDEVSSRGCAQLVEGLITGLCPILGGGGGGGVAATAIRSQVMPTQAQVTAAANDDLLAAATLVPQFAVVARTTAQLSPRHAVSIGEGVIAASAAGSQASSRTPSRSASAVEPSPRRLGSGVSPAAPLCEDFLRDVVAGAPTASTLERSIPAEAFASFYLRRLRKDRHGGDAAFTATSGGGGGGVSGGAPPLASLLAVLWELNLARLLLERCCCCCRCGSMGEAAGGWSESLAEEVWQCYRHHLLAVQTATAAAAGERATQQMPPRGAEFSAPRGGSRRRLGKKAVCLALLRMMAREQRECGADAVSEASVRAFFQQLGGEAGTGLSFSDVLQHLLDAALIIQRLNAYAVVAEA